MAGSSGNHMGRFMGIMPSRWTVPAETMAVVHGAKETELIKTGREPPEWRKICKIWRIPEMGILFYAQVGIRKLVADAAYGPRGDQGKIYPTRC